MGQPAMGGTHSFCASAWSEDFVLMVCTSRMSREVHVRICGGLEVKLLRPTRYAGLLQESPPTVVQSFAMAIVCDNLYHIAEDGRGQRA